EQGGRLVDEPVGTRTVGRPAIEGAWALAARAVDDLFAVGGPGTFVVPTFAIGEPARDLALEVRDPEVGGPRGEALSEHRVPAVGRDEPGPLPTIEWDAERPELA